MTTTVNEAGLVGKTIAKQIGGRAFVMMGATGLAYGDAKDGPEGYLGLLRWKMGGGIRDKQGKLVTHVVVTLCFDDTYKVETFSIRGIKVSLLSSTEGVYADNLRAVISDVTGCYLSL